MSSIAPSRPRLPWPVTRTIVQTGFVVVVVALWELATLRSQSVFFPPPSEIAGGVLDLLIPGVGEGLLTEAVKQDLVPSVGRMIAGWGLAVVIGVGLGLLIGRARTLGDYVEPVINLLRSTPGPALLPVFLIVAGAGTSMRVSLICFGAVWPILLNTIDGVRSVDDTQLATARMFGLPRRAIVRRILIPSTLPRILAGMHVAMTLAFVLMVVSELNVATSGIGFQITNSAQTFGFITMWAWLVILALLGIGANAIFTQLERRALRWHTASHSQRTDS